MSASENEKIIDIKFDIDEVKKAEYLMSNFERRAKRVATIMFAKRCGIHTTGRAFLLPASYEVLLTYWDGYDAEFFDNCELRFPFEWLNKTDDELKEMYKPYWDERDEITRKYKEEQKRKEAEEEEAKQRIRESNEIKEYKKLKDIYGKYDVED